LLSTSDVTVGGGSINAHSHSKTEGISAATAAASSSSEHTFMIKILVPAPVAGSIIGKGGSVISALNSSTGARIKVSQNSEYFPGTQDRVMTISGSKECIAACVEEVVAKIVEVISFRILPPPP